MINPKPLLFVVIFVVISNFQSTAQFESVVLHPFDTLIHLNVYGDFSSMSNFVPFTFVQDFTKGGFINQQTKQNTAEKLGDFNRYHFHALYGVSAFFKPRLLSDSVNYVQMFAGYDKVSSIFASFTDDAFELLMFGNSYGIGNKTDLSKTSFVYNNYNRFHAGAMRSFGKNGNHRFAIAPFISFHKAPLFINLSEASLYTASDTSQIDLYTEGSMNMGYKVENITASVGGGIDMHYSNSGLIPNYLLGFSVENFGVFQYQGTSYLFQTDSIVSLTSFYISSFANIDSTLSEFADSLYSEIVTIEDSISLTCLLPVKLSMTFVNTSADRYNLHGRVSWYPLYNSLPIIELIPSIRMNDMLSLGVPLAWGETGGVQAGLFVKFIYKQFNFSMMLRSGHNVSINPFHTGFSAYGQLSYKF